MFTKDDIQNVLTVLELTNYRFTDSETEGYSKGSYFIPKIYNERITYLDIYQLILTQVYLILDDELLYTDYGYDDESISYVITKADELIRIDSIINEPDELTFYYEQL